MGIVIDHNARRHTIIAKSIQLFAEQGYNGVTYQKVADVCGIARTTLYKYFQNKREIFNYAIWEETNRFYRQFRETPIANEPAIARLERLMVGVIDFLFDQRMLLTVILDFLLAAQRAGQDLRRNILDHTFGIRRPIHRLLVEAIRAGEIKPIHARAATELFYVQLEATVLRLTVSQNADRGELAALVHNFIAILKTP
jgi:AcrR family transcriptional regulator